MPVSSTAGLLDRESAGLTEAAELLPRHPSFRSDALEQVQEYLSDVLAPHRLTYTTRDRRFNFHHRGAKLGAVELNDMQFGGDVMIAAPQVPDFYLLQFMLTGSCRLTQAGRSYDMAAGTVAVINPGRPFTKVWSPDGRQLLLRIERSLLDRELLAWTARDRRAPIEFDQTQAFSFNDAGTVTHLVRMLCHDLRAQSSRLEHPLLRDRVVSALASGLLVGLPHNHSRSFEAAAYSIAPACVRRAERFMEENAHRAVGLADLAMAAGVSVRALQMAFRRFRDTTPMAHLRALRLDAARKEFLEVGHNGRSVAAIASAHGFGHLSRFAADYKARFNEAPSETMWHGRDGRGRHRLVEINAGTRLGSQATVQNGVIL